MRTSPKDWGQDGAEQSTCADCEPELPCVIPGAWIDPEGPCQTIDNWRGEAVFDVEDGPFSNFCVYEPHGFAPIVSGKKKVGVSPIPYKDKYARDYYRTYLLRHSRMSVEELVAELRPEGLPATAQPVFYSLPQANPSGTVVDETEHHEMIEQFRAFNGLAGRADIEARLADHAQAEVTVAVIDTAPRITEDGRSEHGKTIARIVADFALGSIGGPGPRRVETYPGLPRWREFGSLEIPTATNEDGRGGNGGLTIDLAREIRNAVVEWQRDRQGQDKLIINLSVGWNTVGGNLHAPAVKAALEYASCYGALVVVASGNKPVDGCRGPKSEPVEPSIFETLPRPDEGRCMDLGVPKEAFAPCKPGSYCPLVHAVTPRDDDYRHLADFRSDSDARLTALGLPGVAPGVTEPLAGSSVAAAVVSGVAALVWSLDPSLDADAVAQHVYDNARDFEAPAGDEAGEIQYLATPGGPPEQKFVDACEALDALDGVELDCVRAGSPDPDRDSPDQSWPAPIERPKSRTGKRSCGVGLKIYGPVKNKNRPFESPFFKTLRVLRSINDPLVDAVVRFSHQILPKASKHHRPQSKRGLLWVGPQPGHAVCPWCKVKTASTGSLVSLKLACDDVGKTVSSVVLVVWDTVGNEHMFFYTQDMLDDMNAGQWSTFTEPRMLSPVSAQVMVTLESDGTTTTHSQQIPIDPPEDYGAGMECATESGAT